jgi:hypothetical protein
VMASQATAAFPQKHERSALIVDLTGMPRLPAKPSRSLGRRLDTVQLGR